MAQARVRIGAVHALANAIPTTQAAFDGGWPAADVAHLLDGSLYLDRNLGTADDQELASRVDRLVKYSAATGSAGIIVTRSRARWMRSWAGMATVTMSWSSRR